MLSCEFCKKKYLKTCLEHLWGYFWRKKKALSAIFYLMFIFSPNDSLSKTVKNFYFIKKSFRSRVMQNVVICPLHFPESKGQMEVE